jgi:hypothetical protein
VGPPPRNPPQPGALSHPGPPAAPPRRPSHEHIPATESCERRTAGYTVNESAAISARLIARLPCDGNARRTAARAERQRSRRARRTTSWCMECTTASRRWLTAAAIRGDDVLPRLNTRARAASPSRGHVRRCGCSAVRCSRVHASGRGRGPRQAGSDEHVERQPMCAGRHRGSPARRRRPCRSRGPTASCHVDGHTNAAAATTPAAARTWLPRVHIRW